MMYQSVLVDLVASKVRTKQYLPGVRPGSRSQTYVRTFATTFWHVQTFQTLETKTWHFQTFATMMIRRNYRDRSGGGAIKISRLRYLVCPDSRNQEFPFPDFRDRKTKARLVIKH